MEDIIAQIIETKVLLAQTEEESSQRSNLLKELYEKVSTCDCKISDLNREIQSLLKSINELIAEKNSYRSQLEQNKENSEEIRSPDQFLEIRNDVDGIGLWTQALCEVESPQSIKKIKALSRKGVPMQIRGEVWTRLIGNDFYITQKLFANLLETSKKCNKTEQEVNGTTLIPMDLRRTLSSLQVFQEKQPLHQCLVEVLKAFAVFRPDIGYVQGMAYLGAIFVLHQSSYPAFVSFSNLIFKSHMLTSFYSFDIPVMQSYYRVFEYYMNKKVPSVLMKFNELGITPDMFLLEWVYTLFSRCFDINNVSRVMTGFVFSDDSYIYRLGISILICMEKKLTDDNMDQVAITLNSLINYLDYVKVLRIFERVRISINDINRMRKVLK